jgi:hypothetical protein
MRSGISHISNIDEKLYNYALHMRHGFLDSIKLV